MNKLLVDIEKEPLFSFTIKGKEFKQIKNELCLSAIKKDNKIKKCFTYNKLIFTEEITYYNKHNAFETALYIENISDKDSELLENICGFDSEFLFSEDFQPYGIFFPTDDTTKCISYKGFTRSNDEMSPQTEFLLKNKQLSYAPIQGRSCDGTFPYFDIIKQNSGVILCVGWTGQWRATAIRTDNGVRFTAGVENAAFYLKPNEKIKYTSCTVLEYDNGYVNGHNLLRSLMREISPLNHGERPGRMPLSVSTWGGMIESKQLNLLSKLSDWKLPLDVFWMDAGWFGHLKSCEDEFSGGWYEHVGNNNINLTLHPNALKTVSSGVKALGLNFLLWFELERAMTDSDFYIKKPDCFLKNPFLTGDVQIVIADMGKKEIIEYLYNYMCGMINDLKLDWYRTDFNIDVLPYWRENDESDRRGIVQIKYINGLYDFYDRLLKKFPKLMIDNCAGGGNRMDIEMCKRSVTLWRSDYNSFENCSIEGIQTANMGASLIFPYIGSGFNISSVDEYRARSSFNPSIVFSLCTKVAQEKLNNSNFEKLLKKWLAEYEKCRDYYTKDYYPLTEITADISTWCAYQFHNNENGSGIIQIFRRSKSNLTEGVFEIKQIESEKEYILEDVDGEIKHVNGEFLKNFVVRIDKKSTAKIYIYSLINCAKTKLI